MILLYHIELTPELRSAMALAKVQPRIVSPSEYGLPLSVLASGSSPAALPATTSFSESMMVFCDMSTQQVSTFIDLMRRLGIPPIPLKAVLTPTNQTWNSIQLYQELKKEHEYFQQKSSSR